MSPFYSFYIYFCDPLIAPCRDGSVRLIPAANNTSPSLTPPSRGRLEICFKSRWSTVCREGFETDEAVAVCGELNFNSDGKSWLDKLAK